MSTMHTVTAANTTAEVPINEKELHEKTITSLDGVEDPLIIEEDLYLPLKMADGIEPEPHILTARAILVGIILGSLVNASNLYLG